MKLSDFDYFLPKELIAQYPLSKRDEARLMIISRKNKSIQHKKFKDIVDYLNPADVLVINKSKVIPARLFGRRLTGGRIETLLLNSPVNGVSEVLVKSRGKLRNKEKIIFRDNNLEGELSITANKFHKIQFSIKDDKKLFDLICKIGQIPLPPYIKRKPESFDYKTYQTVYADSDGSIASPTAGLHFTNELIKQIKEKGIRITGLILHISYATFSPVKEDIRCHKMHTEYYEFPKDAAEIINQTKSRKGRIIAVGTTSCRVLETVAHLTLTPTAHRIPHTAICGWTDLFIYPPYKFKLTDSLITNFHFPKSTLLMLVSAFAGYDLIKKAYQEAIKEKYRFYSYGDCMLII